MKKRLDELKERIVSGLADKYRVVETLDLNERVFLEVYQMIPLGIDNLYDEEYLCDIEGDLTRTNEEILEDIDYAIER